MIFGQPSEFAIEIYHEPSGPKWAGFGRMCIHIHGTQIGNIRDNHCSLSHAVDRFRQASANIETLWDKFFDGKSDAEIYEILDYLLYGGVEERSLEEMGADWDRVGQCDFLTNTGEMFNGTKMFIICRPEGVVSIFYRLRDDTQGSGSFQVDSFRAIANACVQWFEEQVRTVAPPYFPVNPFDPDEYVPDN